VKDHSGADFSKVKSAVINQLGNSFGLEEILSVEDLGLEDYPKTSTGKVQKSKLKETVMHHLEERDSNEGSANGTGIDVNTLRNLWAKHLGIPPETLNPRESVIHEFADSLTVSRFSSKLRRSIGQTLELQQILENPTVEAQARIIASRSLDSQTDYTDFRPEREGPPHVDDMVHTIGDETRFQRTKSLSAQTLYPFGLSWDDVEDVVPLHDTLNRFMKKRRPQSNNHRHGWICRGKSASEVEGAFKLAFIWHSIMRSMAIEYD
jgi:aryl carrier-like protein